MTEQLSLPQGDNPGSFDSLVASIQSTSEQLAAQASKAVNVSLTVRNWLIGFYIVEFEQRGADRAEYGDKLISKLGSELKNRGLTGVSPRELRRYRTFYAAYPQIREALSPEFRKSKILCVPPCSLWLANTGMSSDLFVSKYQLELPSKEVLQAQLAAERERLEGKQ